MADPLGEIRALLRARPIDMTALARFLDGLAPSQRVAAVQSMSAGEQSALYDAAKGVRPITLRDIVPESTRALVPVIHHGRNSLPAFRLFQKRFCRPDGARGAEELWGYNQNAGWVMPFSGPGYFVAYEHGAGEVLIDYTRLPPHGAPGWPAVRPNSERLSRFIYNGTQDTLRGVSRHVTIGRAARAGRDMPNWFVLCREGD